MWLKLNNGETPVTYNIDYIKKIEVRRDLYTEAYTLLIEIHDDTYSDEVLGMYHEKQEADLQYERLLSAIAAGHMKNHAIVYFSV